MTLADRLCNKDLESTVTSEPYFSERWTLLSLVLSQHVKRGKQKYNLFSVGNNPITFRGISVGELCLAENTRHNSLKCLNFVSTLNVYYLCSMTWMTFNILYFILKGFEFSKALHPNFVEHWFLYLI